MENSLRTKDAAYARHAIADLRAGTPNRSARLALARAAASTGTDTNAAKALWQAYADDGAPA